MLKKLSLSAIGVWMVLSAGACGLGSAKCPTKDQIKTSMKEFIPQEFTVESVSQMQNIKGLCEVVVKIGAQPIVFYVDGEGKYLLAGNLISLKDKKNITRERQQEFMKVSADQLKELEKHVNITL
ncbi:MAG: disulfide isomerase DsbC N-terminal domain-containing protein, partial [Aquificaceae bacterium]|nr:disulfide isomerase DsbC N-terminal domain-containing protein [Aquificaceae bacterium]